MKKTFKILSIIMTVQIFIMIFIGAFISLASVSFGQTTTATTTAATSTPSTFEITGGFASNIVKEEKSQSSFGTETYKATVTWSTNIDSDSHVVASYNLIGDYLLPPFENADNNSFTKNHSVDLKGLSPGRNYYYYVYSKDVNGNTATTDHGDWIKSHNFSTPGGSDGTGTGGGTGTGATGDGGTGGTGGTGTGGTTPPPPFQMTPLPQINLQIGGTSPIVTEDYGVSILTIFKYAMGFIGLIALGAVIYGGILRITAAANPSNIKEGNDYILGAIAGIALLAGAAIIFNTINPRISNIGMTENYLSGNKKCKDLTPEEKKAGVICQAETSTSTFNMSSILGSSTAISNAPINQQTTGQTDQDIKSQMKQDGITWSASANFSGMTALQYDKLRAIATNVYSTSENKIVNVLTTASSTESGIYWFTVSLKKSADPKNNLNVYFKDNLSVYNKDQKIYTLPILSGQGNVKEMDSYWVITL